MGEWERISSPNQRLSGYDCHNALDLYSAATLFGPTPRYHLTIQLLSPVILRYHNARLQIMSH
jgi:hypothetical protein